MRVKFWGVRGSAPSPELRNSRHGGNTTCLEVRLANGSIIILDCGTGMRGLGRSLTREFGKMPLRACIFLTHFHWDHLQGLPFFAPLYKKDSIFVFYSALRPGREVKRLVEGQMMSPYFPVDMRSIASTCLFADMDRPINVNGAVITAAPLNHPQGCSGYRVEADGAALVLATDTEPGSEKHDRALRELARGADMLVHDAQYTPEQVRDARRGTGHSSWQDAARVANEARVKQLYLFHLDPEHDDATVDRFVEKARREFDRTSAASEGTEIDLTLNTREHHLVAPSERRREKRFRCEVPLQISWKDVASGIASASGLCLDISRSGIHFLAPASAELPAILNVQVVLPEEITHRGEVTFRFLARSVRKVPARRSLASNVLAVEVAARLSAAPEKFGRSAAA